MATVGTSHGDQEGIAGMRVSNYVIGAPLAGQPFGILLHGLSGAVDKVPRAVAVALAEHAGRPAERAAAALEALTPADVERLRERGYLTELGTEQERAQMLRATAQLHESDLATAQASMVLVPTYRCSLRCPYCFQSHQLHAGKGRWGAIMSTEQADLAFAAMDRFRSPGAVARHLGLADGGEPLADAPAPLRSIGLFGGEPLGADTLEVVEHIVARARERDTNVWAITNGVELQYFAHLLGPDGIAWLQITFDGLAELHDSRRRGPRFRETFACIADNVDLALAHGARVSVRMNVDATNAGEVEKLAAYFDERGWTRYEDFDANAAVVTGEGKGHKQPVTHGDLVALTQRLGDEGRTIDSYEGRARDTLLACLAGEAYPFRRVANCSAETGQLMFDPLGHVYACWEDIGKQDLRLGTYDSHGIAFDPAVAEQWLTRYPGAIEQCSRCPYALIHRSGCAAHARETGGTLLASACEHFQSYFPQTLARAYESFEAQLLGADVHMKTTEVSHV
jgi:uncharacterized protein